MNNERKIITFTCAAHFFTHFYELLFPALAVPLMLSLKMSLEEVLQVSFFMYLLYGVAALPWGMVSDRFGNRKSLIIFFLGTGASALLASFAATKTSLTVSLAMIGFFASIYHPAGMGLISLSMKNRGMALGINGVAGNLGFVCAPFTAGILNWLFGWEAAYLFVGILCILWGAAMMLIPIDETPHPHHHDAPAEEGNTSRKWNFLILCCAMTFAGFAYRAVSVILPAAFEFKAGFLWELFQRFHFENIEGAKTMAATLLASSIYIVSAVGQYIGGRVADRRDLRRAYLAFHALSLPFVLLMGITGNYLLVLSAAMYVFFALGMQPIENSLVAVYTPGRWRSTGYGIKFILVFGVGSFAVYCAGWIKEAWGLGSVFLFMGIPVALLIMCAVLLIAVSEKRKSSREIPS